MRRHVSSNGGGGGGDSRVLVDETVMDGVHEAEALLSKSEKKEADGDEASDAGALALLLLLYTLQGLPLGLAAALPFLLQSKGAGMAAQARFATVSWPFSLKLLWAPLVDAIYLPTLGRRKSWIIPAQLLLGLLLLMSASHMEEMLEGESGKPDVGALTALFFVLYFLAATQDIAVDGLALTILSSKNKELGATCNAVGQSVGYFLAYTIFLAFNTPEFCNAYFRAPEAASDVGIFTLGGFMTFWGWVFLGSTVCVLFVKKDEHAKLKTSAVNTLAAAYREMWLVLQLPSVRSLSLLLLTNRLGFSVIDSVTPLRLVESGVPKDHLALLASLVMPVGMATQTFISVHFFSRGNSSPMRVWLISYPCRLATSLASFFIVNLVASYHAANPGAPLPTYLYALMLAATIATTVCSSTMFVAQMAFFTQVSDPAIGGTYMTMLNTLANMGSAWTAPLALASVGWSTVKRCVPDPGSNCPDALGALSSSSSSSSSSPPAAWLRMLMQIVGRPWTPPHECTCTEVTEIDGFTVMAISSLLIGAVWLAAFWKPVGRMQQLPAAAWLATKADKNDERA